ncbi:MAG: D-alanine--D-alanine ligase [Myxococcales bacterium]|nr:D-alanine--D-alanine ligase [Myxococcales bacterium]
MARVGVLLGGISAEREVSLRSGEAIVSALASRGHDVVPILVDRDIDQTLRAAKIDVAFLALHGRYGEDGAIQGLLEWMGIPYTGSGVLASALAMDKLKAKELFRLHNIATAPYYDLTGPITAAELEERHGSFGFPVMVKPRREGSSIGVSRASNLEELAVAVNEALKHDDGVLVERYIRAREVHVGIVNGRVFGAIEIVSRRPFFDYQAKTQKGLAEYYFPARLAPTRYQGVLRLAERAHAALGCSGATRVNVLVTEGENEYVLEVNTLPGMTPNSLLPKIAAGAGVDYPGLCEMILQGARLHTHPGRHLPLQGVIASPTPVVVA